MNLFFLQVIIDSAKIKDSLARVAQLATQQKESLWDILMKGGPLMIPLAILLVIAFFVFFERYIAIKKASKLDDNFMSIIRDHIINGNIQAARSLTKNTYTAVGRMIDKGIQRVGKPIEAIERSMENVGKLELYKMEKNLSILSVIGYIGPLFGFLGTIVGMFQLFYTLAATNDYTLSTIAGGIYVKMISSASGLIIGIIAYLGYRFLNSQVDKATNRMEAASADFIDILQEPTR
ncbi:MAG TPA: MotA/TolQ/ExbB proton channel family protein [Puia sp.]|jgi:biopolymer transport protein ExbB|uniref:MotA/TolQ/ExbB proton channel family protein n=1 Tax=Puia sp. TaxID=2045100 RepID=UPI002B6BFF90|nr:MotA/TolQ/ExbB proton channel family protein [Puia sp.]HVU93926.1 MotA/TolQ/ExbB proton channel family protein [Puia sp.]